MGEQAAAEADHRDADAEQRARPQRRGQHHAGEGDDARERAEARDPVRIGAPARAGARRA